MECMLCAPGELVELRPEPKSRYDENAVAVWSERGVQLGYVSAERAPLIGKRTKEDEVVAVFQAMHGNGAYTRIRFEAGYLPCPTRSLIFRSASLPARCGRRSDRCTIPTRFILTNRGLNGERGPTFLTRMPSSQQAKLRGGGFPTLAG